MQYIATVLERKQSFPCQFHYVVQNYIFCVEKNIVEAKEFVRERYKIFERDLKSVTKSEKEMTF